MRHHTRHTTPDLKHSKSAKYHNASLQFQHLFERKNYIDPTVVKDTSPSHIISSEVTQIIVMHINQITKTAGIKYLTAENVIVVLQSAANVCGCDAGTTQTHKGAMVMMKGEETRTNRVNCSV